MEFQTRADFKKATLGQLEAIIKDETNGMGYRVRAHDELKRRQDNALKPKHTLIPSEVQRWARQKSGITMVHNFSMGGLKKK